jgi:hypothetical protein
MTLLCETPLHHITVSEEAGPRSENGTIPFFLGIHKGFDYYKSVANCRSVRLAWANSGAKNPTPRGNLEGMLVRTAARLAKSSELNDHEWRRRSRAFRRNLTGNTVFL